MFLYSISKITLFFYLLLKGFPMRLGKQGTLKDIQRIMINKAKRGDYSPLQLDHYHNYYEIFFLHSGSCRFLLKDSVYPLEKGDLVFIAPGELHHSLYYENINCDIVTLYFKADFISANFFDTWLPDDIHNCLHSFMGSITVLYPEDLK